MCVHFATATLGRKSLFKPSICHARTPCGSCFCCFEWRHKKWGRNNGVSNNSPTPPVRRQSIYPMVKKFNTHVWLHPNSPIFAPWIFLSVSLPNPTFRNWIWRTYSESKLRNFRVYMRVNNFAKTYTNLQTTSSISNATLHHYARHHL